MQLTQPGFPNARRELVDQIAALIAEGMTALEVAAQLGMTHKQVLRTAHRSGIRIPRGVRTVEAPLNSRRYQILRDLADQARVSPSIMLGRVAGCILEEGSRAAARRLGTLARPKRAYVRRSAARAC